MNGLPQQLSRRSVLKASAGTAALAAGGTAVLLGGTGTAAAVGEQDLGTVSVTTDDGSLSYVAIYGDSVVEWAGFDREATYFSIDIAVEVVQDGASYHGPVDVHSTGLVDLSNSDWGNYDESLSGPGTSGTIESGVGLDEAGTHDPTIDWHVVGSDPDGYGLPATSVDSSNVPQPGEGETATFDVVLSSTYTWYGSNDETDDIFSETFESTLTVEVTNEAANATASGGDGGGGGTVA